MVRSPSPVTKGVDGSMPMSQHTHGSSESSLSISTPTKSSTQERQITILTMQVDVAVSNKHFLVRLCERYIVFAFFAKCRSNLRNGHGRKETCILPAWLSAFTIKILPEAWQAPSQLHSSNKCRRMVVPPACLLLIPGCQSIWKHNGRM